jgi:hypothetical protein
MAIETLVNSLTLPKLSLTTQLKAAVTSKLDHRVMQAVHERNLQSNNRCLRAGATANCPTCPFFTDRGTCR